MHGLYYNVAFTFKDHMDLSFTLAVNYIATLTFPVIKYFSIWVKMFTAASITV